MRQTGTISTNLGVGRLIGSPRRRYSSIPAAQQASASPSGPYSSPSRLGRKNSIASRSSAPETPSAEAPFRIRAGHGTALGSDPGAAELVVAHDNARTSRHVDIRPAGVTRSGPDQ